MCDNCHVKPKYGGHDYCGKSCGAEGEKKKAAIEAQMRREAETQSKSGSNDRDKGGRDVHLCEVCHKKPKYQERTWAGVIEHPFCGNSCKDEYTNRRRVAQLQQMRQSSNSGSNYNIDIGSANPRSGLLKKLDGKNPAAYHVFEQFTKKWDDAQNPIEVRAIYRINQQGKYIGRFDDSIEMNDPQCLLATCYYGGQILCDSITSFEDNARLCEWHGCSICLAVRFAFEQLEFRKTSYDGTYGPGIYANLNPARVHPHTIGRSNTPCRVIVQCRVIPNSPNEGGLTPYSAMIDKSGRVFCQKEAIIPTHLIVYALKTPGDK